MSWVETLFGVILFFVLVSLLVPVNCSSHPGGEGMVISLSHMKQLQIATMQMSLDYSTNRNSVQWTCSNNIPLTFEQWTNALVSGGYLQSRDLLRLLTISYRGKPVTDAIRAFAVAEDDEWDTLLFATKNWQGITNTELAGDLYGKRGCVVFRKGGDGAVLLPRQITNARFVGTGGMHNYLPLK